MVKSVKKLFSFWWKNFAYDPRELPKERRRIVAIGGGSGLSTLLRGLRKYSENISAVVTMTDNGASTGRLRQEFNILPPGDIRKCLLALSNDETLLTKLFEYRFPAKDKSSVGGHSLGNLFLAALSEIGGGFQEGIQLASLLLDTKGQVLPSVLDDINLVARFMDGEEVNGEVEIVKKGLEKKIDQISLSKKTAANPKAIEAIVLADVIVIGPGSLYTSVLPNLEVLDIKAALKKSQARKIYVCNVSTERGETEGYTVFDHIEALIKHSFPKICDTVLVSDRVVLNQKEGRLGNINNITTDAKSYKQIQIKRADLIDKERPLYHDSEKLAAAVMKLLA